MLIGGLSKKELGTVFKHKMITFSVILVSIRVYVTGINHYAHFAAKKTEA